MSAHDAALLAQVAADVAAIRRLLRDVIPAAFEAGNASGRESAYAAFAEALTDDHGRAEHLRVIKGGGS